MANYDNLIVMKKEIFFNRVNDIVEKYKGIIIFLLFFPHIYHIRFPYVSLSIIEFIIVRLRMLSLVFLFLLFYIRKKKISKLLLALIIFSVLINVATFINVANANVSKSVLFATSALSIELIIEIFFDDLQTLIESLLLAFEIEIYPNLITVVLFRNVEDFNVPYNINSFFLGTANDMILYLMPAFFIALYYIHYIKNSLRYYVLISAIVLTVILSKSFTTMISLVMFTIIFIYCFIIKKNKVKYPVLLIIIPIVITIIYVLPYYFTGHNNLFDWVAKNIYYNHSLECRIFLWDDAREYIIKKPLLGYGYYNDSIVMIGNEGEIFDMAHNMHIQTILNYGLLGYTAFIYINYVVIKNICHSKNSFFKSLSIAIMCSIYITFITQDYHRFFQIITIYAFIYNIMNG